MSVDTACLVDRQKALLESLTSTFVNYKKDSSSRKSDAYYQRRLDRVNTRAQEFWENDKTLVLHKLPKEDSYFSDNVANAFEELYIECVSRIETDYATAFPPKESENHDSHNLTSINSQRNPYPRLQKLNVPVFEGNYSAWPHFHDLYCSLIHTNNELSKVEKFWYLKDSLRGEPLDMVKHMATTEANYIAAWKLLLDYYENPRELFKAHMHLFSSQQKIAHENAHAIRNLLNVARECRQALVNFKLDLKHCDPILVYFLTQKLPAETIGLWEMKIGGTTDLPSFETLQMFLDTRIKTLEAIAENKAISTSTSSKPNKSYGKPNHENHRVVKNKSFHLATSIGNSSNQNKFNFPFCIICKGNHVLRKCPQFMSMSTSARRAAITGQSVCTNCLAYNHTVERCNSKQNCRCGERHHTLIHDQVNPVYAVPATTSPPFASQAPLTNTSNLRSFVTCLSQKQILLSTAVVLVKALDGGFLELRALIDQGSQTSLISERAANLLKLPKSKVKALIIGVGDIPADTCNFMVNLPIHSRINEFKIDVTAFVMPKLTSSIPNEYVLKSDWNHIAGLLLADPKYFEPAKIDLILGSEVYSEAILDGLKRSPGSPTAQNTQFGWILMGQIRSQKVDPIQLKAMVTKVEVNDLLQKFWETDIVPAKREMTPEERWCEKFYADTLTRNGRGRYMVRQPFKKYLHTDIVLGKSRDIAIRQFMQLERRFIRDPKLYFEYSRCINEYISSGEMAEVQVPEENLIEYRDGMFDVKCCYLPHHAVMKMSSTTTKLRIVFDASRKTSNHNSLNDVLFPGPALHNELPSIIINWRFHRVAYQADLKQMFRQILVHHDDAQFQRIVWRNDPSEPLREYYSKVVTFGTTCAPYLAIRTIHQLAHDLHVKYPLAAPILLNSVFVDDVFAGGDDVQSALELQRELLNIFDEAGFELRKWVSNCEEVLEAVPEASREIQVSHLLDADHTIKTLGIYWQPTEDKFTFKFNFDVTGQLDLPITKRNILSTVARLFDPLGFIAPVILPAKIILQRLWSENLDWDDPVPHTIHSQWCQYVRNLADLSNIKIPRWIETSPKVKSLELHGFCDASNMGYACVVYVRSSMDNRNYKSSLLTSKSKVTPIKPHSIPRLELMAAVLLSDLIGYILKNLHWPIQPKIFAWTDAEIVLHWLKGDPNRWDIFIANRVSRIRDLIPISQWQHIATDKNPADCASRGMSRSELLEHRLWWHGPDFLRSSQDQWPISKITVKNFGDLGVRKIHVVQIGHVERQNLLKRFSSYNLLIRITALIQNLAKKARHHEYNYPLTVLDLLESRDFWIKFIQNVEFSDEIRALTKGVSIPSKSKLSNLNPFLDSKNLMRVGGRLANSLLDYNEKYPIILPSTNEFTRLLIREHHERTMHGGTQLVLRLLRRTFWICNARNTVRFLLQKCVTCYRFKAKAGQQQMGILPSYRVQPSFFAFSSTGVDFCGPIEVKASNLRGRVRFKGYIAVFVCMTTRAVHIELVGDMSTPKFISALKRFLSRRTMCSHIHSDNGTTFVGAVNQLEKHEKIWKTQIENEVVPFLTNRAIQWHFIPPASPHFGGIWEASVKSLKYHLKRVCGNNTYTFEEWNTFVVEIECILNSRPLCPFTSDPEDLAAITPNHFLNGDIARGLPEPCPSSRGFGLPVILREMNRMKYSFWERWSSDYLNQLQSRPKWLEARNEFHINDLVLILDNRLPPLNWSLGRIIHLTEGPDGLKRVATLRTRGKIITRPIHKLCRLPLDCTE